jgi:hypothetical protein
MVSTSSVNTYRRIDANWTSRRGAVAMINLMRFSNGFYRSLRGWRAGQGSVLLCLLALTMLCPLIVRGQELTATLSGIVTDSSGAVIPHASISIELNGVNAGARAVESDGSGNYVATNLAAGTYSITVTATGFETFKGKNIVLNVAEKHAFNVQLKAGAREHHGHRGRQPDFGGHGEQPARPAPSRELRSANLKSPAAVLRSWSPCNRASSMPAWVLRRILSPTIRWRSTALAARRTTGRWTAPTSTTRAPTRRWSTRPASTPSRSSPAARQLRRRLRAFGRRPGSGGHEERHQLLPWRRL